MSRENGHFQAKRVDRTFNASDMLAHGPSAEELRELLPVIGCHTMTVKNDIFNAVKTMLKGLLAAKIAAFLASMAGTLHS